MPQQSKSSNAAKPAAIKTTRNEQLRQVLNRKSGASIPEIQAAFGWQPHTARAAISAQRKAGYTVTRSDTAKGSVFRIVKAQGAQ